MSQDSGYPGDYPADGEYPAGDPISYEREPRPWEQATHLEEQFIKAANRAVSKFPINSQAAPAVMGWRGAFSRIAPQSLTIPPGPAEMALRQQLADQRLALEQAIALSDVAMGSIAIGSGFGGQGKTMVAAHVAAILGTLRPQNRVALVDTNDDMGNGRNRLGGQTLPPFGHRQSQLSVRAFYRACIEGLIQSTAEFERMVEWLHHVYVIRADDPEEYDFYGHFGEEEYDDMHAYLTIMSAFQVHDGGTGITHDEMLQAAVRRAGQYVYVTETSRRGMESIARALRTWRSREDPRFGYLMKYPIVVFNQYDEHDGEKEEWYQTTRQFYEEYDPEVTVLTVHEDRALAYALPYGPEMLQDVTVDDLLVLTGTILEGLGRYQAEMQGGQNSSPVLPVLTPQAAATRQAAAGPPAETAALGHTTPSALGWPGESAAQGSVSGPPPPANGRGPAPGSPPVTAGPPPPPPSPPQPAAGPPSPPQPATPAPGPVGQDDPAGAAPATDDDQRELDGHEPHGPGRTGPAITQPDALRWA